MIRQIKAEVKRQTEHLLNKFTQTQAIQESKSASEL